MIIWRRYEKDFAHFLATLCSFKICVWIFETILISITCIFLICFFHPSFLDTPSQEVAEPLMDVKQGTEDLMKNHTFKTILAVLRAIGNFLNGTECRGFHIDYLSKVPEVKDTVHKHSLLHHLCHMVIEKYPDTSDLYSEVCTLLS